MSTVKPLPPLDYLKTRVSYDPQSGLLTWLLPPLAEANERILEYQSIVDASPAVQKAMGRLHGEFARTA